MACKDFTGADYPWLDALMQFNFRDAVLCPYQMTIGGPEFATLILGAVGISYMIKQDSIGIAAVIAIICGGVFISQVDSYATAFVTIGVLVLFGLVPVLLVRRMSRG